MAFSTTFSISGSRGKVGWFGSGAINFSQLFTGKPQYYAGSVIQVQEVVTIYTSIYEPIAVDKDFGWFVDKQYIGTFQVLGQDAQPTHYIEDDGYLVDTIQKITRYSNYTITANPSVPIALSEGFTVYDCNTYLVPEVYLFPGTNTPVPGQRLRDPGEGKPILRGYTSLTASDLADTQFFPRISGLGLFLKPGVEGINIDYRVAIINDIYTANQPFPVQTCELVQPSCSEQYNAFLLASGPNQLFPSSVTCEAYVAGLPPIPITFCSGPNFWVCPTDPTYTREFWNLGGQNPD
jgi:hypothetical protein